MTAVHDKRWNTSGLGRFERSDWVRDPYLWATYWIAHLAVFLVGLDFQVRSGFTVALAAAIGLAPLWLPSLARYPLARPIMLLVGASLISGLVLSYLTSFDHAINSGNRSTFTGVLLSGAAAIALLLWAREIIPLQRIVLLYGLGAFTHGFVFADRDWKFNLVIPATFVVLGIVEHGKGRLIPAVAVLFMGVTAIMSEGRSVFGFCLLASTLTLWQLRPSSTTSAQRRWMPALLMAALALSIYFMASTLLTAGAFGETLQERSVAQVDASGSLIAGGRPEWAATRALVQIRPQGYGLGVVPSWVDLEAGTAGLASINIDAGGYTRNYMFGGQINLHSVIADLWAHFGWIGAALGLLVLFAIVRSMSTLIAIRAAPTSTLFACGLALWYLFFGPIYSNWLEVCFAVGLVLVPLARTAEAGTTSTA